LIEDYLQDLDELILIPHLFLHQIPFAAVPISENSGDGGDSSQGYLGDRFRLRYVPSLQVLGFCHSRGSLSTNDYSIVENATDDLPFSGFEGAKVAQLFEVDPTRRVIGSKATRQQYRQLLEQTTCLVSSHHAQSRPDNPNESRLQLSDGDINVSQLLSPGWRFRQLDEVYLSCCETGLFFPDTAVDEPIAVSTGFLCAGARGVVASLWSIYDLSSALLSVLYHEQRREGKNRPEALQAAQRKMRLMSGEVFEDDYCEELRDHLDAEQDRISDALEAVKRELEALSEEDESEALRKSLAAKQNRLDALLTSAGDAADAIDDYINEDLPFEHPVHWAGLACYGLA
jgi:CHAT domain-containing protein